MNKPRVSVLMATHNRARFLNVAVESVLSQTYQNFEFLVVDDCSDDETPNILQGYARKDSRIRVLRNKKNKGLYASLNVGLREAQGTYIARLDDDDFLDPQTFRLYVEFLDKHPSYGLVGSWVVEVDEQGDILNRKKLPTQSPALKRMIWERNSIHSAVLFRKEALDRVGLYEESWRYSGDYEIVLRIAHEYDIAVLPQFLMYYRHSSDSISSTKTKLQSRYALQARMRALQRGWIPLAALPFLVRDMVLFTTYFFPGSLRKILGKVRSSYRFF